MEGIARPQSHHYYPFQISLSLHGPNKCEDNFTSHHQFIAAEWIRRQLELNQQLDLRSPTGFALSSNMASIETSRTTPTNKEPQHTTSSQQNSPQEDSEGEIET